jgi:hypothetical protein
MLETRVPEPPFPENREPKNPGDDVGAVALLFGGAVDLPVAVPGLLPEEIFTD